MLFLLFWSLFVFCPNRITGNLQQYYMSQVWWHAGEAEAGSSQVQSQPGLYIKILPPKKKKKKNDTKIVKAKSV
jgi:hypothetical protein